MIETAVGFIWGFAFGAVFAALLCAFLTSLGQEASSDVVKAPETRKTKCVMCNDALEKRDESRRWAGAHKWCETYF